jgi:DNA-binding SARP family transcriptional activator
MEFRVLGALEIRQGDLVLPLPTGRAQIVLATLIAHRNQIVPQERLIRICWEESPPVTATTQIHAFISALRKRMGAGPADAAAGSQAIRTHGSGYRLNAGTDEVDLERFQQCLARARTSRSAGEHEPAADFLREALSLWRGEPFEGLASPYLAAERTRLEQVRIGVHHELAVELLTLGRHADAAAELTPVVADQPYHEGLRGLLMIALHRAGRRVEALASYRQLRRILIDELGIEPGPDIQRVHQQILGEDVLPARTARRHQGVDRVRGSVPVLEVA